MQLYKKGKVKEVYVASESEFEFHFTDQISVFDKVIPTLIPDKGETLCRTSAFWFQEAARLGMRTHFIGLPAGNKMRVKRVSIPKPGVPLKKSDRSVLVPLEVIARYYVAGSLHDRLKAGELSPLALGFGNSSLPAYGAELPQPFVEFTTKLEETDRLLTHREASELSGLGRERLDEIKQMVLKVDKEMNRRAKSQGLLHVDGKKEFGIDAEGEMMLVDTFGTADEDRWWDLKLYGEGKTVELSKEAVRHHYRSTGYHDALMEARKSHLHEPDIPPLPGDVVGKVTGIYVDLFERITGTKFR
ncbi:MAG: phosphoribosylaminoimidazolesuccinocarboxamide synthase [Methanobacteriota archaeon]